ncbi:DNA mismatch repair protein [Chitinophaga caeni]|uniref:DNA mismatch repair protein n=1 Tax=Chitinophaga caeni TaxID=2029983 RepID=A0A291QSL4_9BACT|nr:DNA mismatch repair protein [Chitinophaga caeni]ATL47009.1 DNA mismatch repair protein [Chitinophaga caeni]
MSFNIDKQTLDELNLLGKFRQGSVYHLFNRTKTRGGEQLLDRMFRNPLNNHGEINDRSKIIQYFQQLSLSFPFDAQQVTLMHEYFDTSGNSNPALTFAGMLAKKYLAMLTRDERYKEIIQRMHATILTLNKCTVLVKQLHNIPGAYAPNVELIREILKDEQVERLSDIDIYQSIPIKTLSHFDHQLRNRLRKKMEAVLAFIYEIDVYISVSSVAAAKGLGYAVALPGEANVLSAENLRHPCLDRAVGNDIRMQKDSNMLFLTGANMAGKSTLMKSIGIGFYLAHMGFPVAASKMEFSVREGLYSSINVADNIGLGYSHFYAEVVRVKQAALATASGKRLLLMFDELFKGTNVKDAYDGTLSVVEGFAAYTECLFIVSTHIIEVGEPLKEYDNIRFAYMPTIMEGNYPRYTYKLKQGITEDRQGMMIIRNEGILELLNRKV